MFEDLNYILSLNDKKKLFVGIGNLLKKDDEDKNEGLDDDIDDDREALILNIYIGNPYIILKQYQVLPLVWRCRPKT